MVRSLLFLLSVLIVTDTNAEIIHTSVADTSYFLPNQLKKNPFKLSRREITDRYNTLGRQFQAEANAGIPGAREKLRELEQQRDNLNSLFTRANPFGITLKITDINNLPNQIQQPINWPSWLKQQLNLFRTSRPEPSNNHLHMPRYTQSSAPSEPSTPQNMPRFSQPSAPSEQREIQEEQARRQVLENARRQAEEDARQRAVERSRQEAAELRARKAQEEQARKQAADHARRRAEEDARQKAVERSRQEAAELRARKAQEEQAKLRAREEELAREEARLRRAKYEAEMLAKQAEIARNEAQRRYEREAQRRQEEQERAQWQAKNQYSNYQRTERYSGNCQCPDCSRARAYESYQQQYSYYPQTQRYSDREQQFYKNDYYNKTKTSTTSMPEWINLFKLKHKIKISFDAVLQEAESTKEKQMFNAAIDFFKNRLVEPEKRSKITTLPPELWDIKIRNPWHKRR